MVLGHLTVTSAGRRVLQRRLPRVSMPLGPLLLGAYLPDLVDKPLNMAFGLPGRAFGHSVVVEAVAFTVAALALPGWRRVMAPLGLGVAVHLLEDWVNPVTLLAPLLGPIPPAPPWSFVDSLLHFYAGGGPLVWLEAGAVLYWLGVAASRVVRGRRYEAEQPEGQ